MLLHELKPVKQRIRPRFFFLSLYLATAFAGCSGHNTAVIPSTTAPTVPAAARELVESTSKSVTWPESYHDAGHTGYNPNETALSVTTVGGLKELASATVSSGVYAMALSGGKLFVQDGTGAITAFNAKTLAQVWSVSAGSATNLNEIGVSNGTVVATCTIHSGDGAHPGVCGYSAATGAAEWSYGPACGCVPELELTSGITVASGIVYFTYAYCCYGNEVVALNASTGTQIYAVGSSTSEAITGPPVVGGGRVYYVCGLGGVCAYDGGGNLVWQNASVAPNNNIALTYANGTLFANIAGNQQGGDSVVQSLNASTGAVIRTYDYCSGGCGNTVYPVAVVKNALYVTSDFGGTVTAFGISGGKRLWSTGQIGGVASPSLANGVLYLEDADRIGGSSSVYAFNAATGAQLWGSYANGGGYGSGGAAPPIVANGVLYNAGNTCGAVCSFTVH